MHTDKQSYRQTDSKIYTQYRQTERGQTGKTYIHTDRQTDIESDREVHRQTNIHTYRHTYIQTYIQTNNT